MFYCIFFSRFKKKCDFNVWLSLMQKILEKWVSIISPYNMITLTCHYVIFQIHFNFSYLYSLILCNDQESWAHIDQINVLVADGGWNTTDPFTVSVGTAATPVTRMLPIAGKLWCGCHNAIKILNTASLEVEVRLIESWRQYTGQANENIMANTIFAWCSWS